MKELGWSAPSRPVDAGTARRGILWQHQRLRTLLERARALAESRLDGEPSTPDAVASAIGDIHSVMEVHLRFEETVLLPLLRDDLPIGPERADRLVDEHRQQRLMLAALHKEASAHPELPLLAGKLAVLASWLLADMDEEERSLLNPDTVRDDIVVVDQSSG
jgi:iron-sulfur cluster repair protein YtfE (RIC family)